MVPLRDKLNDAAINKAAEGIEPDRWKDGPVTRSRDAGIAVAHLPEPENWAAAMPRSDGKNADLPGQGGSPAVGIAKARLLAGALREQVREWSRSG